MFELTSRNSFFKMTKKAIRSRVSLVYSRCAHCRRNHLAGGVHKQLGEPFEDFLDDLWVGLLKVCDGEVDADICDASCDLRVGLRTLAMRLVHERGTNKCHECIGFLRRRCAWVVSSMCCGARSHAHARVVGHYGCECDCDIQEIVAVRC
jgi:hypothetical protein